MLRRLTYLIPVWIGISLIAFILTNLTPGDPARLALQRELGRQPTAEETAVARERMGLDDPAPVRYVRWLGDAVTGDLGLSYRTGNPVLGSLAERFPTTLQIAGLGLILAVALALPLGILAALYQRGPIDHASRVVALLGASMPSYWVAYLLILLLSVRLGWLPVAGSTTWKHMIMPALTLGIGGSASLMRLTRSEMLETLGQDYIRTARSKGASEQSVNYEHALRNALLPVVTIIGIEAAFLIGGLIVTETVFNIPGVARFLVEAIRSRDYPIVQNLVMFIALVVVTVNFLVDLAYTALDPRIRLES
jgi:peptide/nickel transport system permease protein